VENGLPFKVNDREAREAFHSLLLAQLRSSVSPALWRVKGGVNLRLFFGSIRYSEDIDLDAEPKARQAMRSAIRAVMQDIAFRRQLASLGIRDVLTNDRPAKDTETTLRFKLRLVVGGGVELPTKVEVSFRAGAPGDAIVEEAADERIVGKYLQSVNLPVIVPHYDRTAAVRQKISALAGRAEVQARDVFDLAVLCSSGQIDLDLIAAGLSRDVLEAALERAFELENDAYASQVLEFLDDVDRAANAERWEEFQLITAALIESILETGA
jgi:hypothetical protein